MRAPAAVLVVDAAILLAAVAGKSSGALIAAAERRALITTDRAVEEASKRIALGLKRPDLLAPLRAIVALINLVPAASLSNLGDAAVALKDAVASRNGSSDDAHILALAWGVAGDIWSTDRDFAGTGVAAWSTPNLMRALRAENAP